MPSSEFAPLRRKIDAFAKEFDGRAAKERLEFIGRLTAPDVDEAVRADIGDLSMSGWTRKKPIQIVGSAEIATSVDTGLFIAPEALGPMRVLTDGRRAYSAGDRRRSGSRVRKKDGLRVDKTRKVKRNTGSTTGRGTWGDVEKLIDSRIASRIYRSWVLPAERKHFR